MVFLYIYYKALFYFLKDMIASDAAQLCRQLGFQKVSLLSEDQFPDASIDQNSVIIRYVRSTNKITKITFTSTSWHIYSFNNY